MQHSKFWVENNVDLVGLVETKIKQFKLSSVCHNISSSLMFFGNHGNSGVARIILLWDEFKLNIQVLIYGVNDSDSRSRLWNELSTSSFAILDHKPWILLGDFNIVKHTYEKGWTKC